MTFTWIDFLIGFFLMNAMPHWILGLTNTRFLSAFGFTAQANIAYSFLNVAMALLLFSWRYGIADIFSNGVFVGTAAMMLIYYLTGRMFLHMFKEEHTQS